MRFTRYLNLEYYLHHQKTKWDWSIDLIGNFQYINLEVSICKRYMYKILFLRKNNIYKILKHWHFPL